LWKEVDKQAEQKNKIRSNVFMIADLDIGFIVHPCINWKSIHRFLIS